MKGLIYTIIAVLIVASTITILVTYANLSRSLRRDMAEKIISDQLYSFERNIEGDVERVLSIVGKRALIASADHVVTTGNPLDDARKRIRELMENGTLYGVKSDFVRNNTIFNWTQAIERIANKTNFFLNLKIGPIEVKPVDSFHIMFKANLTVNLTERTGRIRIDRFFEKSAIVSIEGLEDPLPPLMTSGLYKQTIKACPYVYNHTFKDESGTWHLDNLEEDAINGYYHASNLSASYLDRLEGSLRTSDKYQKLAPGKLIGLQFFVNLQKLSSLGIEVKENQTVIDYLYWDSAFHRGYQVNGMSLDWFRIDNETEVINGIELKHSEIYGVDDLLI